MCIYANTYSALIPQAATSGEALALHKIAKFTAAMLVATAKL
jgi:hypothetical protein